MHDERQALRREWHRLLGRSSQMDVWLLLFRSSTTDSHIFVRTYVELYMHIICKVEFIGAKIHTIEQQRTLNDRFELEYNSRVGFDILFVIFFLSRNLKSQFVQCVV